MQAVSYILVGLIAAGGGFIQACTGFGYAIFCMALWPLIVPFRLAGALEAITALFNAGFILWKLREHLNVKLIVYPLITALIFNAVGLKIMVGSTDTLLRRVLGGVLMLLAIYFVFFSERVRLRPTPKNGLIAGAVSGFCSGMFNIGGPPMVAYFLSVTDDKNEYNASLQCYFCVTTVYLFVMHIFAGSLSDGAWGLGLSAVAGVLLGTLLGVGCFRRLSMKHLKKLVYAFMALAGCYLLLRG